MPITGAIFDCDGTLVDSMPMWFAIIPRMLDSHGVKVGKEFLLELESLNLEDECEACHERFGIGESWHDVWAELDVALRREYRENVRAWPGCREFLDELRAADIPMDIATSTPVHLVKIGLEANGLLDYFGSIYCTSDVGRGKDYPDVYLAAQNDLGTQTASTWVFEDAPFGAQTAKHAGYPVVAIINDHDGRDPEFMRQMSDILVTGYPELSLGAIEGYGA